MSTPDVSVIVPIFNAAEYLDDCISSILASTYANFELILVDDGSTDTSGALCDAYAAKDNRVRVMHTPNHGVSAARNTAIKASRGRYLTFVDADDIVAPQMIECLRSMLDGQTPAAVVGVTMDYEKPATKSINKKITLSGTTAAARLLHQKSFLYNTIPGGKMFDGHLFDSLHFNPGRFEDLDIMPRLFVKAGHVAYKKTNLYYYRQHSTAFSHTVSPARLDALNVTANLETWAYGISSKLYHGARDRHFSAAFNIFNLIVSNKLKDTPHNLVSHCWTIIRQRRRQLLFSRHTRLKNRIGALVSYLGRRITTQIAYYKAN